MGSPLHGGRSSGQSGVHLKQDFTWLLLSPGTSGPVVLVLHVAVSCGEQTVTSLWGGALLNPGVSPKPFLVTFLYLNCLLTSAHFPQLQPESPLTSLGQFANRFNSSCPPPRKNGQNTILQPHCQYSREPGTLSLGITSFHPHKQPSLQAGKLRRSGSRAWLGGVSDTVNQRLYGLWAVVSTAGGTRSTQSTLNPTWDSGYKARRRSLNWVPGQ